MSSRRIRFKENTIVTPCPHCGNNREFSIKSSQFCEDCCEVWAVCAKCGYDPFENNYGYKLESVMGGCGDDNVHDVMPLWNDVLAKVGDVSPLKNSHDNDFPSRPTNDE